MLLNPIFLGSILRAFSISFYQKPPRRHQLLCGQRDLRSDSNSALRYRHPSFQGGLSWPICLLPLRLAYFSRGSPCVFATMLPLCPTITLAVSKYAESGSETTQFGLHATVAPVYQPRVDLTRASLNQSSREFVELKPRSLEKGLLIASCCRRHTGECDGECFRALRTTDRLRSPRPTSAGKHDIGIARR